MNKLEHPERQRRKLYGRRKGPKLSARQAGLRRTLLSELAYRARRAIPLEPVSEQRSRRSGWRSVLAPASI